LCGDATRVRSHFLKQLSATSIANNSSHSGVSGTTVDLRTRANVQGGTSMATKRKSSGRKYGKAAGKTVESAMRRKKRGTLRSGKGGKGGKVKSRKQAIAIGLSEARKKGAKVPKKKAA